MTPAGRLLRRSAGAADRAAVFASVRLAAPVLAPDVPARRMARLVRRIAPTALVLATLTLSGGVLASSFWPAAEAEHVSHGHPDLPPDPPQLRGHPPVHAHSYILDDLHPRWS